MFIMAFWLFLLSYFVTKAMIEVIIFDSNPEFNLYMDIDKNEYHVYRFMEYAFVFMMILVGGMLKLNVLYLVGMFAIGDFVHERIYNLFFHRWISPSPFKIYTWTVYRKWWFPLIELAFGGMLVWLFG